MDNFDTYFNERKIIKLISKYRIAVANKRHDIHILNGIRVKQNTIDPIEKTRNKIDEIILKIVPPRRKWVKFSKKNRDSYENSSKLSIARLEKAILFYHNKVKKGKESEVQPWYIELQIFLKEIKEVLNNLENYKIKEPIILREKKDNDGKPKDPYRPIAHYKYLIDKIIIGQTAKYLTDNLDSELCHSAVYAFRSTKGKENPITHHDTVTRIQEYLEKNKGNELWVSECDIKKFYDCVNHDIAKKSLKEISERLKDRTGIKINNNAFIIFDKYLDSYSFNYLVYPKNETDEMKDINGIYAWEEEELKSEFYNNGIHENIGVPQGGAISCLIANLVLDKVDRAIISTIDKDDDNLLYMRYCDDMILIHPNKQQCEKSLEAYMKALNECNLLCHKPIPINKYTKEFWKSKSKLPYNWGKKSEGKVPWLSFVGYQIRYDSCVRIRKKSIKKEISKQKKIISSIEHALNIKEKNKLNFNSRITKKQLLYRAEQKLIAISVGRVNLRNSKETVGLKPSWTIGFKKLNRNYIVEKQLKILDRSRTKAIHSLRMKLSKLKLDHKGKGKKMTERYFGSPFSYHNFILKK